MKSIVVILLASTCIVFAEVNTGPGPKRTDIADLDTLELVQIVFRHGDRTPLVDYPTDKLSDETIWHPYADGLASLTKKGKSDQYDLGKYIRKRYDGFLSKIYKSSEIFVQTSEADRTIMSALANLAGLFPPTPEDPKSQWNDQIAWQPLPIHTVPKSLDNFISFSATCPRFVELKKGSVKATAFAQAVNEDPENKELFAYLGKHAGLNITDFGFISDLYDTLYIQKAYNFAIPEWINDELLVKMQNLTAVFFDERVLVPTLEAKKVRAGPLVKFVTKNMDVKRNSPDLTKKEKDDHRKAKLYMISGHDTTGAILLGALGVFDTQFPSYASAAIVEMHKGSPSQPDTNVTDHYVKVFYRNDTSVPPYEFEIPECGYPCKLDTFKSLFGDIMIDGSEWEAACRSQIANLESGACSRL